LRKKSQKNIDWTIKSYYLSSEILRHEEKWRYNMKVNDVSLHITLEAKDREVKRIVKPSDGISKSNFPYLYNEMIKHNRIKKIMEEVEKVVIFIEGIKKDAEGKAYTLVDYKAESRIERFVLEIKSDGEKITISNDEVEEEIFIQCKSQGQMLWFRHLNEFFEDSTNANFIDRLRSFPKARIRHIYKSVH